MLMLLLSFPVVELRATTAIALRNTHRIVLATDSRAVYRASGSRTECKLFETHGVYATVSGLAHYGTAYRATDAIRDGFAVAGSFDQHIAATANSLQRRTQQLLNSVQLSNPTEYEYLMRPTGGTADLVQIAVAAIVRGRPMLGVIELRSNVAGNGLTVKTTVCPENCPQDAIFYLGFWERIKPYVANSGSPRNVGSAASLDRLIRMEIDSHPNEVGAPINILEVNSLGARWLQNGGNCSLPGVSW